MAGSCPSYKCAMSKENKRGIKLFIFYSKNDKKKKNLREAFFSETTTFFFPVEIRWFLSRIVSNIPDGRRRSSLRIVKT